MSSSDYEEQSTMVTGTVPDGAAENQQEMYQSRIHMAVNCIL